MQSNATVKPRIVLLWNQSNTFGLSQDAALIEDVLRNLPFQLAEKPEVVRLDPLQPPSPADIVIHLEVPHPVWFSWAPTQIWMVNPEWCSPNWLQYCSQFTSIFVKEASRLAEFGPNAIHVAWAD